MERVERKRLKPTLVPIDESILGGAERTSPRPRGFLKSWRPQAQTRVLLEQVQAVLTEYQEHLPLTVRQIFYRLVGVHGYAKTEAAYERLNEHLRTARRARVIDMDAIRDDGLIREEPLTWEDPDDFTAELRDRANYYRRDRTEGQRRKLMLWCEAGGMVPQLERVAAPYGVTVISSGGFDSVTVKHQFGRECANEGRPVSVLHVGDLDPSGVHMPLALAEDVEAFASYYDGDVAFQHIEAD